MESERNDPEKSVGKAFIAKKLSAIVTMKRILETLRHDDFLTSTDVSKRLGISRPTAKRYLEALVEIGELMREKGVPAKLKIGGTEVYLKRPITRGKRRW